MEDEELVCLNCEFIVKSADDYCPNCGVIFAENTKCSLHKDKGAEGICLICLKPYCKQCGLFVNEVYLCSEHSAYEIIEGMARIYGSSDNLELAYYKNILEDEGLHPFLYSRKSSPLSFGNVDHTLFSSSGEYDGHLINEIKLMLPLNEVIQGEKILEPLINDFD